jgi:hypothetical protein
MIFLQSLLFHNLAPAAIDYDTKRYREAFFCLAIARYVGKRTPKTAHYSRDPAHTSNRQK